MSLREEHTMKKILGLTFAAAVLGFIGPAQALAWYCFASSPSASGWATSGSRRWAVSRALRECAIRTPYYQTCYLRYCRR
jgi:hypothetical protein